MGLFDGFDIGKIKESIEAGAKSVQGGIASIDVEGAVRNAKGAAEAGVKAIQDGVSNIKVDEIAQGARDLAENGAAAVGKAIEDISGGKPSEIDSSRDSKAFVSLLWLMAYVDGNVSAIEKERLNELASGIDEGYETYAEEIEQTCVSRMIEGSKEFGRLSTAKMEAQKVIESLSLTERDAKLVCWNLFAVANADGLVDNERDFIRFVGEKAGVDAAVFEELKNYCDTIAEIGKARDRLAQSNRSYGEIEPLMDEFAKREQNIVNAAQALISDR